MHFKLTTSIALAIAVSAAAPAQTPSTSPAAHASEPTTKPTRIDVSDTQVIDLWPADLLPNQGNTSDETILDRVDTKTNRSDRIVKDITHPTLRWFALANTPAKPSTAVIVIPGGGYAGEVFDREGYFIADTLRDHGIAAFVLKYRLPKSVAPPADKVPPPIADVQRAVRLVRANAERFNIDPHRIGVMGFSAGGHVAGMAATLFDAGDADSADPIARQSSRPDFAVLMYAVSSMHESLAHAGSRKRLLGEHPDPAIEDRFSTAQRITRDTPPLLLVHAKDDNVVKFTNSEEVAAAAKSAGVSCDFIAYDTGGHGFGLGAPGTPAAGWMDRFFVWLDKKR